jgi:hypothetical protein
MPSIRICCAVPRPDRVLAAILDAAEDEGFEIVNERRRSLEVRFGNLAMSILFGIFVAYAYSLIEVEEFEEDEEVEITMTWDFPWWQGVFGGMRSRKVMDRLADRIEREIERDDGEILSRKVK